MIYMVCYHECTMMVNTLGNAAFIVLKEWYCRKEVRLIPIDLMDSRPIYEQVTERFKLLILRGIIKADEKIPSVRNLAVELSINPNTIQRAYAELEKQGYIYTVKGKGNFAVGADKLLPAYREEILLKLREVCEQAKDVGVTKEEMINYMEEWRSL